MKKYFAILGLLALLIPLVSYGTFHVPTASAQDDKSSSKISSLLGLQVEAKRRAFQVAPLEKGRVDILQAMQAAGAEVTPLDKQQIFIHFAQEPSQSEIQELEAMGLTLQLDSWIPPVGAHPTGFLIADMPLDALEALAAKDFVATLDTAEQVLEPHNDLAVQKINADDVWSANYTGANVTIAVLDSGLDVTHNDIPTPTESKDYSYWPTLDDTISNNVTGHGTHVTGSALGRGTQSSGTYKGTAPGADLVFLKIGRDDTSSASTAAMVNAIKAAVDNYTADIITVSYGGWGSYHDGTSQISQSVDYAVSQGAVVFISAGNDAADDQHYSGNVSANSTTGYISVNVTNAGTNDTALYFNLVWYDGMGTSNDLELEYYDSTPALLSANSSAQSESSRGTEAEWSYYNQWVPSGNSTWYLKVKNNSANSQFFHIYYYLGGSRVKFDNPDANYTISSPADADSAIAVGAYTTRKVWYDYANNGWQWTYETVDQISTFSSRGPRVDTGAPPKPNIVAPGCGIISCRDGDVYLWPSGANYRYIDNDGPNTSNATGGSNDGNGPADYYMNLGTSMATPLAAGVAALILEKYPTWTPAQVKQALESTATKQGTPGHDNIYGWGLIDALAAMTTDIPPAMETILESQGEYYNTAPALSNFGFDDDVALDDGWYQMDSYTGNWTSLFTNNGSSSWDYDNWSISQSEFDALFEGSHTIYFMASDNATNVVGDSGEWHWQFFKDITPPTDPTNFSSTNHTTSVWSNDNTVNVTWTDATDNLSGLDGYSILWDTSANTTWSANKTIEKGSENTTSPELADGNSHYFHIRSVDNAGNWQSTVHLGPFYIDTTPPTDPTNFSSTNHTTSVWSSDNTVDITWTDATDNLSGLDGYSILWDTSANTTWSANKTIEKGSENTTSPELADGNSHYFHIRSKDNAGNWQSTVHLGPFFIDATTPPTMEAIVEAEGQYYSAAPSFSNFGFDDRLALDDGWYQMDSYTGNWTALFTDVAATDILDIAVASDNTTIYAVDKERNKIYKSTNAGVNWTELTNPTGATELQLVAVASDNVSIVAVANTTDVWVTTNGGTTWGSLGIPQESGQASATALYDISISSGNGTPTIHYVAVAGIESGPLANVWYYDFGAASPTWKETNSKAGFGATLANSRASAVAFSPNFASDLVMVAITEEDDGATGTDNVSFEIFRVDFEKWNEQAAFADYPVTIVSNDGITGLDSASISLAPDYHAAWDTRRDVFVGLTVAGDADAMATSGIYRLVDDNVTALKTGEQIHSVAYSGSNLVAGEYDTTDVWRSADPMATTPTVNVTDAANRPGGDNKVVVAWVSSKVVAGTSGNLSAFAVSTDNGTTFNDILVITDTSWDNDSWTIPGFAALAEGSHTIYFKASDDVGNIEGESGEWSWQFYKGSPPAPPPAGGGGGGGGGGASGVTPVLNVVTEKGRFTEDVTAKSDDRKAELYIPQNTIGLNRVGQLISSILMKVMEKEEAPATPADSEYIGQVYRLGPDGATFDPPIDLTIKYDQSKIPEGVAEQNLVVAMFDSTTGQWENLESTVDLENDAVTAKVSHFTAFAILARTSPASFTIADLSVTPSEVNIEESLTISVLVTNTGDLTGSYEVSLKIDDMVAQTKEVTLDGGDSETVSFSVTPDTAGEHTVNISDLLGTFEVKVPEAPAAFSTSALNISPAEVNIRESVTISVTVTNTGDLTGTHEVSLRIDKIVSQTKEVTLEGNSSEEVTFTITKDTAGTYAVEIDGLTGSFVIREEVPLVVKEEIPPTPALEPVPTPTPEPTPTPRPNWWLIGGIITGVVTAGLIYYFLIRKRITLKSIILRRK